ncbi:MAG: T9SS type A sorting domain-containing protein, partial [Flexibacteraceae bacterium]
DFTDYNGITKKGIARLNADGSLDENFNLGTGSNSYVTTSALQSNGKILIGGNFTSYNGNRRNFIARLNADGSLDTTFNIGNGANSTVSTIAVQEDGKIIIGGLFSIFNGVSRNSIARLNANGSLDETFNPGSGVRVNVSSIALQTDGKIIIGGVFSSFNGTPINRIARLNSNGSLDLSFNPGSGFNNEVTQVSLQTDGKIVVVGGFTSFNGISINRIARLNANGSLDETFNSGIGADDLIVSVASQTNGKIILGGDFTTYNGISRNRIARLNINGSLDMTFNPETGANEKVRSMALQTDGKLIVGGDFTAYNGTTRNYLARINADGILDTAFNLGTENRVYNVTLQADSKVIISGFFSGYSGFSTPGIARIHGLNVTSSSKKSINAPKLNLYPNPTTGLVTLTTSADAERITIINAVGQLVYTSKAQPEMELNLSHLAKGVYIVQLQSNKGVNT